MSRRMNEIPVECRKKCTSASSGTESYDDIFGSNPLLLHGHTQMGKGTAGEREQFKISFYSFKRGIRHDH